MLKPLTQLELIIEGRLYHFTCDPVSPLAHVKEALAKFMQYACNIEDQILANQKAEQEKAAADAPPPEVEPPKEG